MSGSERRRREAGLERNQLIAGPEPVPRQAHHVLLAPSGPADVFGLPIARFHGVCRPFLALGCVYVYLAQ